MLGPSKANGFNAKLGTMTIIWIVSGYEVLYVCGGSRITYYFGLCVKYGAGLSHIVHFHFKLSLSICQLQNWIFVFHSMAFGWVSRALRFLMVTALGLHVKWPLSQQDLKISKSKSELCNRWTSTHGQHYCTLKAHYYQRGLSILTQNNSSPLKFCRVSCSHSLRPLISHMETTF